jgi:hypothetical protein
MVLSEKAYRRDDYDKAVELYSDLLDSAEPVSTLSIYFLIYTNLYTFFVLI